MHVLTNGHCKEPDEGQQSPYSWAEFLAGEPAQLQGRNGKPKPSSLSLFERALSAEQEREKELVGARPAQTNGEGIAPSAMPSPGCPCMRPFLGFWPVHVPERITPQGPVARKAISVW